jgi:peptidoglycan hydrolase-like protein with peptidoglycan-binding domain
MAARKRTTPKKAKKRNALGLFSAVASTAGRFILAHPRAVLGASSFAVVFSIISANALWYQPSTHPSPMFRTRDDVDPYAVIGYRSAERLAPQGNVTTFSFQRPEGEAAAPIAELTVDQKRISDIQRELAKRGFYHGAADGIPTTELNAAILAFEEGEGMELTGLVSDDLLITLMVDSAAVVAAIPKERPIDDIASQNGIDPVAAAIRDSKPVAPSAVSAPMPQQKPQPAAQNVAKPTAAPAAAVNVAADTAGSDLPKELVAQIQQGLVNSSYTHVTVDGVAGPKTREAIRSFEKHYRLPETGIPNQLVLNKLKSIGAFNRPAL